MNPASTRDQGGPFAPDSALVATLGQASATVALDGARSEGSQTLQVAREVAVSLSVGGVSQAVMMATPCDLEDFALGFALSESWIAHAGELLDCEIEQTHAGWVLHLRMLEQRQQALKARRRTLAGRTGCGLCGVDSLEALERPALADARPWGNAYTKLHKPNISDSELLLILKRAAAGLPAAMPGQMACGGLHGAAWVDQHGEILCVREDIGRHNALDKLIGALAKNRPSQPKGFVLMSSRASYELVHKLAATHIEMLACLSAPSSAALEVAQEHGVALWAFVRPDRATRFC